MPNYLDLMRLKRLAEIDPFASNIKERIKFPAPRIQPTVIDTPLTPPEGNVSPLMSLQKRDTPRIKDYSKYLESEPRKGDYSPGKLAKILAAVSGVAEGIDKGPGAGINQYRGITEMPYIEAMEEYGRKGGRLKELADLEYRGMTDEQKLAVQMEDYRLKGLEEARQWMKTSSDIKLSEKRIDEITKRIETAGLSVEKNDQTGELEVVDKVKGSRISLGKFAESIKEKTDREQGTWFNRYTTEETGRKLRQEDAQANSRAMQEDSQAAALNIEGIRTLNDRDLIKLRTTLGREDAELKRKLEGMSPAAQKTALELAFQQVSLDNPELQANDSGKFMIEVRKRLKGIRKRTDKNVETVIGDDPAGLFD